MKQAPNLLLDELELDALAELINLGVSKAACSLAEMVHEHVTLTVPQVKLVTSAEAIAILGARGTKHLVGIHQSFAGDIAGRALLMFPEAQSLELVRAVVGGELSHDEIIELEQEALAETGNIILNACLATIANELRRSLKVSLPEILHGESKDFFNLEGPSHIDDVVMFIYINFAVQHREISGYIAVLLDVPSLNVLKVLLNEYITHLTDVSRDFA